jgi:hypothetical protein
MLVPCEDFLERNVVLWVEVFHGMKFTKISSRYLQVALMPYPSSHPKNCLKIIFYCILNNIKRKILYICSEQQTLFRRSHYGTSLSRHFLKTPDGQTLKIRTDSIYNMHLQHKENETYANQLWEKMQA